MLHLRGYLYTLPSPVTGGGYRADRYQVKALIPLTHALFHGDWVGLGTGEGDHSVWYTEVHSVSEWVRFYVVSVIKAIFTTQQGGARDLLLAQLSKNSKGVSGTYC